MTDVQIIEETVQPVAHVTITYTGPIAPHWEIRKHFGDDDAVEQFWVRTQAKLLLLPKHDPQFRRNRERVNRDAETELIVCSWDLGAEDAETVIEDYPMVVEEEVVIESDDVEIDSENEDDTQTSDVNELEDEVESDIEVE